MASPSLECPLDLELTSAANQGQRVMDMADQRAQPKETESSGRSSGFSPVNDDELIGGVNGSGIGSNGAPKRKCTETTNFHTQLIETTNNNNNNNNNSVKVESSRSYHLTPTTTDATSMRTDHKQHQQQICLDSSLTSHRPELTITNLEDEISQLLRSELYGSLPQNDLCSNRDELIGLTARQIRSLCERLIYDRERKLRDEYDRRLATKLAEQYELFARTNYLNTSSEPSRAQTPGTTTSNTALDSDPTTLASQAQQLLQAAVAAQQHNNNNSGSNNNNISNTNNHRHLHQQQAPQLAQQQQQQQDPNVAALAASAQLLSALSQFSNPELMKVQSRLIANTLAAANTPGSLQQANDLAAQLQQVVAAKSAQACGNPSSSAASLMLSQALQQQSESISQPHRANSTNSTSNNNHDTTIDTNNNYHHNPHLHLDQAPLQQQRGPHAEMSSSSSSPLLTRHSNHHHHHHHQQQASHTALAQQLAAAMAAAAAANSPLNLGNPTAAAVAAQLASVARASDSSHTKPGQHPAGSAGPGPNNNGGSGSGPNNPTLVHSIPHPHSHHALSHPTASLLLNNPHYQTVRTKYSTRRYSRRRVGPEEAMADPAIRATAQLKMPVVPKTILIVLKHRLTVQTAITLACSQTGERLRKGAIQKKLEAMFREPGAVDSFLAEWDHPNR